MTSIFDRSLQFSKPTSNLLLNQSKAIINKPLILNNSSTTENPQISGLVSSSNKNLGVTGFLKELINWNSSIKAALDTDKSDPRSRLAKAKDFGGIVQNVFSRLQKSDIDDAGDTVKLIGKFAQDHLRDTIKNTFVSDATEYFGLPPGSLKSDDFLKAGFDWVSSGFDPDAFETSLKTASTQELKGAGAVVTGTGAETIGLNATASKVIGGIGAAYSAYEIFKNWGNGEFVGGAVNGAATGAYLGSIVPGLGTLIGGTIGGILGLASGFVKKSGKHKDQLARDEIRDLLINNGMISKDCKIKLADGSDYDIGKDGGFNLTNVDGSTRHAYDVDFSNPLAGEVVGMAQGMAALIVGGNPKLTSDFTGYFVNAALSNAKNIDDAKANLQEIHKQLKLTPELEQNGVVALIQQGKISEQIGAAYLNGFKMLKKESSNL